MKQPPFLLKLAAVVSSLLLAGGFVSYRAGAINWLMGASATTPAETMFGGSKSKTIILIEHPSTEPSDAPPPDTAQQSPPATTQPALIIMSGSKSGNIFPPTTLPDTPAAPPPASSQQPPPAGTQPAPIVIPSPKAGPIFTPPSPPSTSAAPPPATPQPSNPAR